MKRIISVFFTAVMLITVLSSCHAAIDIQHMEIKDINGGGTRRVCIYSWVGNEEYISLGEAHAAFLKDYLKSEIGEAAKDYTVKYEGIVENTGDMPTDAQINDLAELSDEEKARGYHCISMEYSFDNIDDYNIKTERIYSLSEELALSGEDENYGRGILDEYSPATLIVKKTEEKNYYNVTFNEKGQTSVGLTSWAIIALWRERDNSNLWKTAEITYEPLVDDMKNTIYAAQKTTVNVKVGNQSKRIRTVAQTPVAGQASVVGVDYTIAGEIYSETVPEQVKNNVSPWDIWAVIIGGAFGIAAAAVVIYAVIKYVKKKRSI